MIELKIIILYDNDNGNFEIKKAEFIPLSKKPQTPPDDFIKQVKNLLHGLHKIIK